MQDMVDANPRTRNNLAALTILSIVLAYVLSPIARSQRHMPPVESGIAKVDPNTAPWWVLAELPGIGETKAREIVRFRGSPAPRAAKRFQSSIDLDQVRGIGPKTVERVSPYLRFDEGS